MLQQLATECERTKNPLSCIKACGLLFHPAVQTLLASAEAKRELNRKYSGQLASILYHVDPFSLHEPLPGPFLREAQSHQEQEEVQLSGDGGVTKTNMDSMPHSCSEAGAHKPQQFD